jgi:hypothetical protein
MDSTEDWETAGFIGVDSALVWIGDPAYVGDRRSGTTAFEERFPEGWDQFASEMGSETSAWRVTFEKGHEGLGVALLAVDDGMYAVDVRRDEDGRVAEARILFD